MHRDGALLGLDEGDAAELGAGAGDHAPRQRRRLDLVLLEQRLLHICCLGCRVAGRVSLKRCALLLTGSFGRVMANLMAAVDCCHFQERPH